MGSLATTARIKFGACAKAEMSDCRVPGLDALQNPVQRSAWVHTLDRFGDVFHVNIYFNWFAILVLLTVLLLAILYLQKRKDSAPA